MVTSCLFCPRGAARDERLASADALGARGAIEAADDLRAEAAMIDRYLA